jgi:hypothetical protein
MVLAIELPLNATSARSTLVACRRCIASAPTDPYAALHFDGNRPTWIGGCELQRDWERFVGFPTLLETSVRSGAGRLLIRQDGRFPILGTMNTRATVVLAFAAGLIGGIVSQRILSTPVYAQVPTSATREFGQKNLWSWMRTDCLGEHSESALRTVGQFSNDSRACAARHRNPV